ncbi:MAG: hypothetical protein P8163_19950 [Candidatus Thiodiazotropha sp.]
MATGFFDLALLKVVAVAIPLMAIGMYVGGQIHSTLSQQTFQKGISFLLIISGFSLLLK